MNQRVKADAGFSFAELLVVLVLLGVALVPAMRALTVGMQAANQSLQAEWVLDALVSKLEITLAAEFDTLDAAAAGPTTASTLSDGVGADPRIELFLSRYDATNSDGDNDPFTNGSADLLWVRVYEADSETELTTLVSR
ncbi:MAG: prepilin-type N-terminal cleavage/methylation domain-containing protein [Pseudomonadota bacterium]